MFNSVQDDTSESSLDAVDPNVRLDAVDPNVRLDAVDPNVPDDSVNLNTSSDNVPNESNVDPHSGQDSTPATGEVTDDVLSYVRDNVIIEPMEPDQSDPNNSCKCC